VEYKTIHGTLVSIYGVGVLLQGKSGVGKSESALELVKRGHIFVADDAVDVAKITDRLYGKANSLAQNFIEVRGLGVLNIARMFGVEKTKDSTNIDVIIDIIADDNSKMQFERLGKNLQYKMIEKVKVPYYRLPSTVGRKISDLIETTVIDLKLKLLGYNSAQEYINRYRKVNRSNNKNIV
jgi:HPr kinase/phosphorylase